MTSLLYICRYNIDRSPVAEQMTNKQGYADLHVSSAGLREAERYPSLGMTGEMRVALDESGYRLSVHSSRRITNELLRAQDVILCMKRAHVKEVLEQVPDLEGRVHTLPEYAGFPDQEVSSPPSIIKKFPGFFVLKPLPSGMRNKFYQLIKRVDSRDYNGVIEIHRKIVKEIELYVERTLERMATEGIISSPTQKLISQKTQR